MARGAGVYGGKSKGVGKGMKAAMVEWNLTKGDIYYQAMQDFYAMDKGTAKGARAKPQVQFVVKTIWNCSLQFVAIQFQYQYT